MNKRVELPLMDALYSAYQYQGPCTTIIANNPTIRNWYLNEHMSLACSRKFLKGYTTPEITIPGTSWSECPYFETIGVSSRFLGGHVNKAIRGMLDEGYYIVFMNIDDYYVEGKSWYKKRHFNHDGMICGYDQDNKTYCLYSYDSNWIYRKFWTSQRSFNKSRVVMEKQGMFPHFFAVKATEEKVPFLPRSVYAKLGEYLDSNLEKYPFDGEGSISGIVVHAFMAEYVAKLYSGDIPYERTDRRVFRLIWEHKKAMMERIQLVEMKLGLSDTISKEYAEVVNEANTIRMLYASHILRRRDSVLPIMQKKLLLLMEKERELLTQLLGEMERKFYYESVEISEKKNAESSVTGDL